MLYVCIVSYILTTSNQTDTATHLQRNCHHLPPQPQKQHHRHLLTATTNSLDNTSNLGPYQTLIQPSLNQPWNETQIDLPAFSKACNKTVPLYLIAPKTQLRRHFETKPKIILLKSNEIRENQGKGERIEG